jgi:hypothetical protein
MDNSYIYKNIIIYYFYIILLFHTISLIYLFTLMIKKVITIIKSIIYIIHNLYHNFIILSLNENYNLKKEIFKLKETNNNLLNIINILEKKKY